MSITAYNSSSLSHGLGTPVIICPFTVYNLIIGHKFILSTHENQFSFPFDMTSDFPLSRTLLSN